MAHSVLGRQFTGREALRSQVRLAQVGQRARAEAYSGGHKMEEQSFYGHTDRATATDGETRLTAEMADRGHAANMRYEREQKEAHESGTADYEPKPIKGYW